MTFVYSDHAIAKIEILRRHGIYVDKETIESIITDPEKLEFGYMNRLIAQRKTDNKHVLRIVYEEKNNYVLIITIYPGKIKRYD